MKIEKCIKKAFVVIGKEGSTLDGQGFIQQLWADANAHFSEVQPFAKTDQNGHLVGIWVPCPIFLIHTNHGKPTSARDYIWRVSNVTMRPKPLRDGRNGPSQAMNIFMSKSKMTILFHRYSTI